MSHASCDSNTGASEVIAEGTIVHPGYTIVGFHEVDLLLPFCSPSGIIVSPWTLVVLRVPRVSDLGKPWSPIKLLDVKKTVSMTRD